MIDVDASQTALSLETFTLPATGIVSPQPMGLLGIRVSRSNEYQTNSDQQEGIRSLRVYALSLCFHQDSTAPCILD